MEVPLVVVVKRLAESCLLCFRSGQVHLKCAKHQHENSATLPLGWFSPFQSKRLPFENDTVRVNRAMMLPE
jgi:hypothetical protein